MSQTNDNCKQTKINRFSNKISDYELITLIGVGSFGRVYRARYKSSNDSQYEYCAVKRIAKKCSPNVGKIFTEVSIHLRLKHNNILQLHNVIEDEQYVYLVLELCNGGTIAQLLKLMVETNKLQLNRNGLQTDNKRGIKQSIISHNMIRNIMRQLCSALDYLHRHSIVHRDLNLNNILLLSPYDGNAGDIVVKIADFGLAIDLNSSNIGNLCGKPVRDEHSIPLPVGTTICGTPGFISPEVWSRIQAVSSKSDVFSLGSIIFSLISGYTPKGKLDLSTFPPFAADLICRLLAPQPESRPSIEEISKHPYIIGPFRTDRLLPINKLTKTLQLSINDDGTVILNFFKKRISIDISKDGENICIKAQNDCNYTFDTLPSTHWKKYMYASRFVDLVKAKTPRISIYCKNDNTSNKSIVKCCLMENNDFEATILDIVSNELCKVLFDEFDDSANDTNLNKQLIYMRSQCFEIEKQLINIKNMSGIDCFPACFGHKTKFKALKNNQNSLAQQSVMSSQILRSVNINGIGVASQLSNGVIQVTFADSSAICVASNSQITYRTPNGDEKRYHKHDPLPEYVKEKLALLPHAVQQLRHTICSNNNIFVGK